MVGGVTAVLGIGGQEVVYDFQTRERGIFTYKGHVSWLGSPFGPSGICTTIVGASVSSYVGFISGFTNRVNGLAQEYSGPFWVDQVGPDFPLLQPIVNAGGGIGDFTSVDAGTIIPNGVVGGVIGYVDASVGLGISDVIWASGALYLADYNMNELKSYDRNIVEMMQDIRMGNNSLPLPPAIDGTPISSVISSISSIRLAAAQYALLKYQAAFPLQ
jgi:hypothetical protein